MFEKKKERKIKIKSVDRTRRLADFQNYNNKEELLKANILFIIFSG